jgi:hypothetical protein
LHPGLLVILPFLVQVQGAGTVGDLGEEFRRAGNVALGVEPGPAAVIAPEAEGEVRARLALLAQDGCRVVPEFDPGVARR